jgi:hypothetical protein
MEPCGAACSAARPSLSLTEPLTIRSACGIAPRAQRRHWHRRGEQFFGMIVGIITTTASRRKTTEDWIMKQFDLSAIRSRKVCALATAALLAVSSVAMSAAPASARPGHGHGHGGGHWAGHSHGGGHHYRHGGGYYRGGHGYYHDDNDAGAAIAAGVLGLAIGAIAAGAANHNNSVAYCEQRFRSYDPRSGTYLGYDGLRHPCP